MKKKFSHFRFYVYTATALLLTGIILVFPSDCLSFASNGLTLWFNRMVPTLFPFMVLSGIMIRMNLTGSFVRFLEPVLGRLFRLNANCIYGIAVGFLCGFPMGAHVAAQLYEQKKITKSEASLLLSFCNNIGPVYFLSFVLPTLKLEKSGFYLFAMYGLPLLYGLVLRYTVYYRKIHRDSRPSLSAPVPSLLSALDESIFSSLASIAKLGGYMIFFNLLFIFPWLALRILDAGPLSALLLSGMGCVLEITGGIGLLGNQAPVFVLCVLPFGGLSCIAQTYSMIQKTDLSIMEYIMHKMILTAVTVCFYLFFSVIRV